MKLQELKDSMAKRLYGITTSEAQASGNCIQCKMPAIPRCYSEAGRREYQISGLCEICFDNNFGDSDKVSVSSVEYVDLVMQSAKE